MDRGAYGTGKAGPSGADFAARHGVRGMDTIEQMAYAASAMAGKRLTYKALIADNGLPSGARSG